MSVKSISKPLKLQQRTVIIHSAKNRTKWELITVTPIPTKLVAAEYSTAVQKFPNELIGARITSFENKYLMQKTFKESSKSDYRCMISVTRLHYLRRI